MKLDDAEYTFDVRTGHWKMNSILSIINFSSW